MPSGYSVLEYTGDGSTDTFAINFTLGYLSLSHITCRVGDEVDGSGNPMYRTLISLPGDSGRVRVGGAVPGVGEKVLFRRITPKTVMQSTYTDGSPLDDSALDASFKQPVMIAHELLDGFGLQTVYSDINLTGHKITNVSVDVDDPTSLCTVGYVGQVPVYAAAAKAAADAADDAKEQTVAASSSAAASASASGAARDAAVLAAAEAQAANGGVKISGTDTTSDTLSTKLQSGPGVQLITVNSGGNEKLVTRVEQRLLSTVRLLNHAINGGF